MIDKSLKLLSAALLVAIAAVAAPKYIKGATMPQNAHDYLMLELSSDHCTAEVLINGVPVVRVTPDRRMSQMPIHEYLLPGKNTFQMIVEPGPTPSRALEKGRPAIAAKPGLFARMRLMEMPQGAFPDDPRVKTHVNVEFRPEANASIAVPVVREAEFNAPDWMPASSWPQARKLTEADSPRVVDLIQKISVAMGHGDVEPYIAAAQMRFAETSAAYQLPLEQQLTEFRAQFKRISSEPGFQMRPIVKEDLDLRICGNGHMIDVVDKTWDPALRSAKNAKGLTRYRLPVKVIFVNGEPEIVR
jgi:hypothetical protein